MIGLYIGLGNPHRASLVLRRRILRDEISTIVGGDSNIVTLMYADDAVVTSGSAIDRFVPTIGANITPYTGATKAVRSTINNRTAAVFTPGTLGSYISGDATNARTVLAVAQWLGTVPFVRDCYLTYVSSWAQVLLSTGTSSFTSLGTKYVDGSAGAGVNGVPHCYASASATAGANSYLGGDTHTTYTFDGPVWFWARFATELSAGQIASIYTALKKYYTFLL
jgi:hypothetical protein